MNAATQKLTLAGAAGPIEALLDLGHTSPQQPEPRGIAVIAHPHPLYGGTMDNKVVQTLARAFVQCGWTAVRFNFRGVGASAGTHEGGVGEAVDMQAVIDQVAPHTGNSAPTPLAIAGFSFGAYVATQVTHTLWPLRAIEKIVLIGAAASRFDLPALAPEAHMCSLLIHGEHDDTVPLASVMDWARPQSLPITVVPGGSHFFHGQLPLLKNLVVRHLLA
jgi:alpha/beta superfamily hydrolase